MCQQYHNLDVALIAAHDAANETHEPQYVAHWGGWFGVFNLYELCVEALPAEYTIFPDYKALH